MTYKRVIINGEVYPGEDIKEVVLPSRNQFYWKVYFLDGRIMYVIDHIVVEVKE